MKGARMLGIVGVAVVVVLAGLARPAGGATWYVNQNGFADFNSIQAAIDDPCTVGGDEIEVAPGTYYEAIDFNDKAVRLYSSGGADVTTIDANGAYHAVQCVSGEDANTILEGFTITGGNANGSGSPNSDGGGMLNDDSSPTVNDCNFIGNAGSYGGGMYNGYGSNPSVTNCIFNNNTATYWGAGMFNKESSPSVTDCNFLDNSASWDGGGMFNENCSPAVTNCRFINNTASKSGGGMYSKGDSSPTVTNCTFSMNTATECGGGMYNFSSSPTVTECTFTNNSSAVVYGGGMYNYYSSPTVTNCTFTNNSAGEGGGGMYNWQYSSPTVTECAFTNNSAVAFGGGMYNDVESSPMVTNCTFTNNSAGSDGGGMYNWFGSSPAVTNCIFWGDTPDEIYDDGTGSTTVNYSDIQGDGYPDANNIDADPCFIDANSGDLRLRPDSPCIDAGNNTAVPSSVLKDLAGMLRFADDPYTIDAGDDGDTGRPVVDMGAYEFQGCGAIPQNLLANPGFETGDARGWMANWGLKADSNQVHDGNYSGLASGRAASWDGAYQSVMGLMDDGKTYRISGWVRLQNADSNYVQLTVKKTDSDGTHFYFIDSATGSDNQWVHLDGTLALDVNGQPTELFVYFEGPAPDVNFYVDDASVTEVTGELNHNGGVDFFDFSLFASYYRFDCSTQDCGLANLYDCDKAINERDLAILICDWLVGVE